MLNKTRILLLVVFFVMCLVSCSTSLPKNEPDLGMEIDRLQLNKAIKVSAPQNINSYKIGKQLELEVINLSDQTFKFTPIEIQIFQVRNDTWLKISDNLKTILVDNFIIGSNEGNISKYVNLKPQGPFPDDKMSVTILPDVKSNIGVLLRIFVFAHSQEGGNIPPKIVGAYVDVFLNP